MPLILTIGLPAEQVSVSTAKAELWSRRSGQWTEFYARVLYAQTVGAQWLNASDLAELRSWKSMLPQNVGKAVARHLQDTRRRGACPLQTDSPTLRWRLHDDSRLRSRVSPGPFTLEEWLRERGMGIAEGEIPFAWLRSMTDAQIDFGRGCLSECESHALDALRTQDISQDCKRVAGLMLLRAAAARNRALMAREHVQRLVLGANRDDPSHSLWGVGALGDYIRARLLAIEAIDSGADEAKSHVTAIRRKLEASERSGNLASQLVLANTLGLLACRERRYGEAQYHLNRCIIFSFAVGDLFTLGGAMFNLVIAQLNLGHPAVKVRPLLELSVELDRRLAIGRSSAQAEILLSRLFIDEGRLDDAEATLREAGAMVRNIGSPYDRGCLDVAWAKLLWARSGAQSPAGNGHRRKILSLLEQASESFRASGRKSDYVDEQIGAILRGEGLSLSCLK